MRGGLGFGVVLLLVSFGMSVACSDGEESGQGSGATGGASGSAGSGGSSAGSAGSSGSGGSSGSADAGPLGGYLDRVAAAYCEAIYSCAELHKDFVVELLGGKERCPEVIQHILGSDPRNRERSRQLAAGSLRLQNDKLEECLAFQRTCLLSKSNIFTPCREVLEGSVASGGACRFDDECAGDAYCASKSGCPGTCAPRQPAGSACQADGECAGRYASCELDSGSASRVCRQWTVVEDRAAGEPCGSTASSELGFCSAELWCADAGGGQHVCREQIPRGGACSTDFEVCTAGNFCDRDVLPGSCQPVTVAREGEACDMATLTFCDSFEGLFCVAGKCEATGNGGIGTHCGTDTFNCDLGLFCDRTDDTCRPPHAAGDPCTADLQCVSGTCGSDSRCAASYCGL